MVRSLLVKLLVLMGLTTPLAMAGEPAEATMGWDGLRVKTADGFFDAQFHLMMQARANLAQAGNADPILGFELLRPRPLLVLGVAQHRVWATMQAELVGTATVIDARVDGEVVDGVVLGAGKMIVPFSRGWNTVLPVLQTPDRTLNQGVFAPGRRVGGYAQLGTADEVFRSWVGVYDPRVPGAEAATLQPPLGMVRVQLDPLGAMPFNEVAAATEAPELRFSVGAAALAEPVRDGSGDLSLTTTVDAGLHAGGFTAFAEGFLRTVTDRDLTWGTSAQVGYFVVPRHLDLVARFTAIDSDGDGEATLWPELVVGGYIVQHHAVVQLRYRAQLDLGELSGHLVTLQTQFQL